MQRIVLAIVGGVVLAGPSVADLRGQFSATTAPSEQIQPLLPPGVSDFNIELYGKQAYTWTMSDGTQVIEIQGDFQTRMGQYKLAARGGIVWFNVRPWQDRKYLDLEVFLWQGAEVVQPAGTIETGPALLVTLRSFGTLVLNVDSHAAVNNETGDLFKEGLRARGLLDLLPTQPVDEANAPLRVAPTIEQLRAQQPKLPKKVQFSADHLIHEQIDGESVVIVVGNVFVSQGSPAASGEYLELHADAAVLFVKADTVGESLPVLIGQDERPKRRSDDLSRVPEEESPGQLGGRRDPVGALRETASQWVSSVYLEGDVILTRGERMIRASRLFYDFDAERALILDVVTRALDSTRSLPIYVRAKRVRQLSPTEYEARQAQITTSEFHTPHVAIGADRVYLQDRTPRDSRGTIIGVEAGTYEARHTTMNVEGVPLAYWPFSRGDFSRDRMAFRAAKVGYDSDFGVKTETEWYLFNLMGLEQPQGYDATLKMDYFTKRGPGVGIDVDYEQEDYFGLLRTYYINDHGEDDLGEDRGGEPDHENRGRALWRHRQYLPRGWELSLEASYLSDDQYLESFHRNEWENAKDQETALYLVKRQDNWQFSTLANWRINEFLTQTEHLPESMFSLIGEPLADFATWYHEMRGGVVRYRPDNRRWLNGQTRADNTGETGSVLRGDTRDELQFPLPDLGPMKLTPYVMGRATGWDDSPDSRGGGSTGRLFGSYGVQANTIFTRVDDSVESRLLDLHRLRHIIKTDATVWNAHANKAPYDLSPFDAGVEDIADFGGGTIGVRQRLQTKRGGPGRWRTVDWITFDTEAGFFSNAEKDENTHGDFISHRPEDSISSNFLAMNFQYRLSDTTVLVYDGVYDWNRGNVGTSNISLGVEREPRMAYFVGWRYIHDTNSNLMGFGANYKLNEKHTVAIREYYDIDRGRNYTTELVYIRRWPRWYTAVAFDVDRSLNDIGVNLSVWPEGAPKLGLGSKRYTGLADSVGIRP